ncbi:MAG: hypothetical protein M5R41_10325 [Bacteroidia bacterium]|nr:hypothetical protein [Bacteroidia bacterium]
MLPDGETYNFLLFMASGDAAEERALRDMAFVEFAKRLGMRMARTVLTTDAKHLIKTR